MGRVLSAFILALVFTGCATQQKYGQKLQNWVGRDANELLVAWGPAAHIQEMPNGGKLYTFISDGGTRSTATYNQFTGGVDAQSYSMSCKTTFFVYAGVVSSWRFEGNTCYSY